MPLDLYIIAEARRLSLIVAEPLRRFRRPGITSEPTKHRDHVKDRGSEMGRRTNARLPLVFIDVTPNIEHCSKVCNV